MTQVIRPSFFRLAPLYPLACALNEQFKHLHVTEEDLKNIGVALWNTLQLDETLTSSSWVIESASMAVHHFPWESMYHPQLGFLARHPKYILSRRFSPPLYSSSLPKGPLRILLFTTQSKKHKLFSEFEQHLLRETLHPYAGQVQLYAPEDGRFSTFIHLLNFPWHVVLLVGHSFQINRLQGEIQTFFAFEHEELDHEVIPAQRLVQAFENTEIQCVVVATCDSTHLAMSIAQSGLPHVVGMGGTLLDRAGTVFIQQFCLALVQRRSIGNAVQQGRYAMQFLLNAHETWGEKFDPSVGQWSLPILFSQAPEQTVVDWIFHSHLALPSWLGSQIKLPPLFLGRRKELRTLGEALRTGQIRCLFVRGKGGTGKTALVGQLVKTLIEWGYRVFVYQQKEGLAFHEVFTQICGLSLDEHHALEWLTQKPWIVWIDQFDQVEEDVLEYLKSLCHSDSKHLRILVTSRKKIPVLEFFHDYDLAPPDYCDFSRYIDYLGLRYSERMKPLIYHVLEGNFRGAQLLQSFPIHPGKLLRQLSIVKRYLQAYWRE